MSPLGLFNFPFTLLPIITILALSGILFGLLSPHFTETSYASTIITATIEERYVSITSSGNLNMQLTPKLDGVLSSAQDSLLVKTNVPSGHQLFISTSSTSANSNRLYKNGDTTGVSGYISPSANTSANPNTLSTNTWGFAVPNTATGAVITGFDSTYATPTPNAVSKWATVPTLASPTKIQETATANTNGVNLNVYYAAKVNTVLASGIYNNTVTYTAIAGTD